MRSDWRGRSSSSTINSVRLGFMTWLEACSVRTVGSKWMVAGTLEQFSITPAPAAWGWGKIRNDNFTNAICFHPIKAVQDHKNKDFVVSCRLPCAPHWGECQAAASKAASTV